MVILLPVKTFLVVFMQLLKNKNKFTFSKDLYVKNSFFDKIQYKIYCWRRRFKILGMGFGFFLTKNNNILISNDKSHPFEIKQKKLNTNNLSFKPQIKGYKNRILLIRMNNNITLNTKIIQNIYQKLKPNYYRRKGVGFYNDAYKYKKGKKKFV